MVLIILFIIFFKALKSLISLILSFAVDGNWINTEGSILTMSREKISIYLLIIGRPRADCAPINQRSSKNRNIHNNRDTPMKAKVELFFPFSSVSPSISGCCVLDRYLNCQIVLSEERRDRHDRGLIILREKSRKICVTSAFSERGREIYVSDEPDVSRFQEITIKKKGIGKKEKEEKKGKREERYRLCRYRSDERTTVVPTRGLADVTPVHCF